VTRHQDELDVNYSSLTDESSLTIIGHQRRVSVETPNVRRSHFRIL